MKPWMLLAALSASIALGGSVAPVAAAAGAEAQAEKAMVSAFVSSSSYSPAGSRAGGPLKAWNNDLLAALKAGDIDSAAQTLSARYGLPRERMRSLIMAWIVGSRHEYDERKKAAWLNDLKGRYATLLAETGGAPLVREAAAATLSDADECRPETFASVAGPGGDAAADWFVAAAADCPGWYGAFVARHPTKATAAIMRMTEYGGDGVERLAAFDRLVSDEMLGHVAQADRDFVSARLHRIHLGLLFELGLTEEAVAVEAGLSDSVRTLVMAPRMEARTVTIDGLSVRQAAAPGDYAPSSASPVLDLAAAAFLAGDRDRAGALLEQAGGAEQARVYLACAIDPRPRGRRERCKGEDEGGKELFLDQLLSRPQEDPYILAEVFFAGSAINVPNSGVWADIVCRLFAEPGYASLCENVRESTADAASRAREIHDYGDYRSSRAATREAIRVAGLADYPAALARLSAALEKVEARYGGAGERWARTPGAHGTGPRPSRFEQRPIPAAQRGEPPKTDSAWIKTLAPLPGGFEPVRIERDGARVAAITVSQSYDPTGEISRGGYWVHLSADGGKTWRAPLYTGLSELYPYVVWPESKLPLFNGEALDLAVEVRELDTDSITYPPVGLRTRRRESDLYLKIPIAELERDSDRDGLTDIAADHLLLGRTPSAGGTPFVVGATSALCKPGDRIRQEALGLMLQRMFRVNTGAIIEPVDRPPGDLGALGAMSSRGVSGGYDRPILVMGDPADFACIRPDRLMIVYGEKDLPELRRRTPDFHPLDLGHITFNRAGDRGFFSYSFGWAGGTLRLRRVDGKWVMDEISSWIT